jgi:hypothetical protein
MNQNNGESIKAPQTNTRSTIRPLTILLLVLVVILSGYIVNLNTRFEQQRTSFNSQINEIKSLRETISQFSYLYELRNISLSPGVSLVSSYSLPYDFKVSQPSAVNIPIIEFYAPMDNLTVQVYFTNLPANRMIFPLTLQQGKATARSADKIAVEWNNNSCIMAPIVWSFNITENRAYSGVIPAKGWYTLSLTGPIRLMVPSGVLFKTSGYWVGESPNDATQIHAQADVTLLIDDEQVLFAILKQY